MAWLAVDKNGSECIFEVVPIRFKSFEKSYWKTQSDGKYIELKKGSVEKLIGKKLTFEDEPVEL